MAWQKRARTIDIRRPRLGWEILSEARDVTRTIDRITALYNRDGKLIGDMPAIRRRMQEIYASERAAPDPDDVVFSRASFFDMERRYTLLKGRARMRDGNVLSVEITVEETLRAMLQLNTGRASDFSGMRSGLLRWFARYNVGEASAQPFLFAWTDIPNGILMRGDPIPDDWRMQIVCPVIKRGTLNIEPI